LDKEDIILLKINNAENKQKQFEKYLNRYKILYILYNYTQIPQMFLNKINNSIELKSKYRDKVNAWIAYGIYDFAYLEKKDKTINLYENNFIPLNIDLYYFDSKNILMEVAKPIEGLSNKGNFSLIVNIELKKIEFETNMEINRYNINGYNNLKGAIEQIYKALKNEKNNFASAQIYKSLGPKDLTIIIEDAKLETLFDLIEIINRVDEVNRTFTIFSSNKLSDSNNNEQIDKNILLTTHIRIPKNSRIFKDSEIDKKYKKLLENTSKDGDIHLTTGVMDLVINWNSDVNVNKIFKWYEKLLPYMTDYQTKIEKKLRLNS
jgi:nitrate reductase NapAB chaperone NapD